MLRRQSQFGPPLPGRNPSTYTVRMVPLTSGVDLNTPWPLLPPGSSTSMSNFIPLDGALVPRSRLSSLNTIRTLAAIKGITPYYEADGNSNLIWLSDATVHGLMLSNGSISKASFISAGGMGSAGLASGNRWNYATVYDGNLDKNMVLAVHRSSLQTILALYVQASGAAVYSFLTSAPRTHSIGVFDNYVVAFSTHDGSVVCPTRIQWCVRGEPSNWTGEGSGFEDLLDMRGTGMRVVGTADGRLLLFSDLEIWYGLRADYPSQFQFYPLDKNVGCIASGTVAETDLGVIFLGSDMALRLLPKGGGPSQVLSHAVSQALRPFAPGVSQNASWGVYDPIRKLYHFFLDSAFQGTLRGLVIDCVSGAWGYMDYNSPTPDCGTAFQSPSNALIVGNLFFGNSTGTVHSANSVVAQENGANVTSFWRSAPVAADLPGNHKQLTEVHFDYRATSKSTVTLKVSVDGGNNYESTGRLVSLTSAPVSGRVVSQPYLGGAFLTMELTSQSTGYELHRIDATMGLGGHR